MTVLTVSRINRNRTSIKSRAGKIGRTGTGIMGKMVNG